MALNTTKQGFGNTDLQLEPYDPIPDIEAIITQTISRLLGWDNSAEKWRSISVDTDGRILVSTSPTQGNIANQANISVGLTSVNLVPSNASRRVLVIQNISSNNVYLGYGITASASSGLLLPPNAIYIEDIFTGDINAIASAASSDVRIIEI